MTNNISSLKPVVEFYVLDGLHTCISHRGRKIGEQANLENSELIVFDRLKVDR